MHNKDPFLVAKKFIEKHAHLSLDSSRLMIEEVRLMSNISTNKITHLISLIKSKGRVAIHFHPDRLNDQNQSVAASPCSVSIQNKEVNI